MVLGALDVVEQHVQPRVAQHVLQPGDDRTEEPALDVRDDDGDAPLGSAREPSRLG